MYFNEPLPRLAPYEWASGVKASAWMKYFFLGWIFLLLTDLILDLFVHFLIYHKKQLGGIFVKKKIRIKEGHLTRNINHTLRWTRLENNNTSTKQESMNEDVFEN